MEFSDINTSIQMLVQLDNRKFNSHMINKKKKDKLFCSDGQTHNYQNFIEEKYTLGCEFVFREIARFLLLFVVYIYRVASLMFTCGKTRIDVKYPYY